jgi:RNA polymerase sigma-70 factor (ECF subfamily)
MRLLRALEATAVADTREFFNLAAAVIRRELIDLARHFHGPRGLGANHASSPAFPAVEPVDRAEDPAALDRWTALHEAAGRLPAEEREAFGLIFYHAWTQERVAELFGVDVRTVRRRWCRAVELLHVAVGHFPS